MERIIASLVNAVWCWTAWGESVHIRPAGRPDKRKELQTFCGRYVAYDYDSGANSPVQQCRVCVPRYRQLQADIELAEAAKAAIKYAM